MGMLIENAWITPQMDRDTEIEPVQAFMPVDNKKKASMGAHVGTFSRQGSLY
jgi:hypothetical protein